MCSSDLGPWATLCGTLSITPPRFEGPTPRMTIDALAIPTARSPVRGTIRPPGSKSITNRALVCAALARGESTLTGALDSQDTRVMADGLARLGIGVDADWPAGTIRVRGAGGVIPAASATLDCAASGTTIRFLAALCALGHGTYRLDEIGRAHG